MQTVPADDLLPVRFEPELSSAERRVVRRCLVILGTLSTCTLIGVLFSLYLVVHAPLLLVALSPLGRHQILVAPMVDPLAFLLVATARELAFSVTCFYLGRALGPVGAVWLDRRAPQLTWIYRWLERLFARASHLVVLLLPGGLICAIAGSARMHAPVFLPLVTLGLLARTVLVLEVGGWLRGPIEALMVLFNRYWLPGTIVLIAVVAAYRWRRRTAPSPFGV